MRWILVLLALSLVASCFAQEAEVVSAPPTEAELVELANTTPTPGKISNKAYRTTYARSGNFYLYVRYSDRQTLHGSFYFYARRSSGTANVPIGDLSLLELRNGSNVVLKSGYAYSGGAVLSGIVGRKPVTMTLTAVYSGTIAGQRVSFRFTLRPVHFSYGIIVGSRDASNDAVDSEPSESEVENESVEDESARAAPPTADELAALANLDSSNDGKASPFPKYYTTSARSGNFYLNVRYADRQTLHGVFYFYARRSSGTANVAIDDPSLLELRNGSKLVLKSGYPYSSGAVLSGIVGTKPGSMTLTAVYAGTIAGQRVSFRFKLRPVRFIIGAVQKDGVDDSAESDDKPVDIEVENESGDEESEQSTDVTEDAVKWPSWISYVLQGVANVATTLATVALALRYFGSLKLKCY